MHSDLTTLMFISKKIEITEKTNLIHITPH